MHTYIHVLFIWSLLFILGLFQIGYGGGGGGGGDFSLSKLIARYILTGVYWPRWVKQLNSRAQTIYVKQ